MADIADTSRGEQEQAATAVENKTAALPYEPPYPQSWMDRLTDWVGRLPAPAWLFYLGMALLLVLARTIAAWSDGSYLVGVFFPAHVFLAGTSAYLLFTLHYLDDRAGAALSDFRGVLTVDDVGYTKLHYQITTMPARPTLLWSLAGLAWGMAIPFMLPESQIRLAKQFTSPAASVIDYILIVLSWLVGFVVVYHTIHQLRLVSRIYVRHTAINIFDTAPLYGLSRIAAMTTIALLFLALAYFVLAANWQIDNPVVALTVGVPVPVALATFVWPLLGAHGVLQREKARWQGQVALGMETTSLELNRRVKSQELQGIDGLKNALDGLVSERGALDKVSTWPWDPGALRAVVTALLLPIVLWGITRVLERLGF